MGTSEHSQPRLAYSPAEAARLLGVSRGHIYSLIRGDKLRVVKIGRSARIPADSIDALLAERAS